MVKFKYSDTVNLQVSGPRTILPKPISTVGRTGMTWLHFLNGTCGLKLDPSSNYFICTSSYTVTNKDNGWTADLNEPIKTFVDKYSRKKARYSVRLHTGIQPDPIGTNDATATPSDINGNQTKATTTTSWLPSILRKPTPTVTAPVKKFATTIPLTPGKFQQQQQALGVKNNKVFLQPTPAIVISTRGPQLITPIQPDQQVQLQQLQPAQPHQQQLAQPQQIQSQGDTRNGAAGASANHVSSQKRPQKSSQSISEFSIGAGARNGAAIASTNSSEPSPPQLTRYDDSDQTAGRSNTTASTLLVSPKPTSSITATATAASPGVDKQKRTKRPVRRYEEDSYANLRAVKIEPIDIEMEEVAEPEREPIEEPLSEEEICNRLGIEDGEEYDDTDDNASLCTAASVEERELRRSGIQVKDVKSSIEKKLDRFDESMLRLVQKEIRKLRQNRLWDRNVKRSPLACHMLAELFKDGDQI